MAGIIAKSALSKTANCFCCTLFRVRSCTAQAVFVSCGRRTRRGGGGDATGEASPQAMSRRHCRMMPQGNAPFAGFRGRAQAQSSIRLQQVRCGKNLLLQIAGENHVKSLILWRQTRTLNLRSCRCRIRRTRCSLPKSPHWKCPPRHALGTLGRFRTASQMRVTLMVAFAIGSLAHTPRNVGQQVSIDTRDHHMLYYAAVSRRILSCRQR